MNSDFKKNDSILFDNHIVNSYKTIIRTNSTEKLTEIFDHNYYLIGLQSDSYDMYKNQLKNRNYIATSLKNNFSKEMVEFYTNMYFDVNMMSFEERQDGRTAYYYDKYDYYIDGDDPDSRYIPSDDKRKRYAELLEENDKKYQEHEAKVKSEKERLFRKEGESLNDWEKRVLEDMFKKAGEKWKESKEKFKKDFDETMRESGERLKSVLEDYNKKRDPDASYGTGINYIEHKKGESKFMYILKAIANGIIKVVNFIVNLLKYCANLLYALIKRLVLFIRKKIQTNVELIKKVCERMRQDQSFLNRVNNTYFETTCFFPEFFQAASRGTNQFVNFLANLLIMVDKATVKTDFEKIKSPKQVEQQENEIENTVFKSVPEKLSEEIQKFANFGGTGSIYIEGGTEKEKQTAKGVAESIVRKKLRVVVCDEIYRQSFHNVRDKAAPITNQVWLNYCLNAIENTKELNDLIKSLSTVNKQTLNSIKTFKNLNKEYNLVLSGKKSIELEKSPNEREQLRIGEGPGVSEEVKALWSKVVIDHCKKQIIITNQLANLLQFASNFSASLGKYCTMGYNNICIEASKFAWEFRKFV